MSAVPARAPTLFHTRYAELAQNTIDYWVQPDSTELTAREVDAAIRAAPVLPGASLQIYVHVPFCAQRCRFCAFSGGNSLDFAAADRYAKLLVGQLRQLATSVAIAGHPVRSVHVGGGSPDLLGTHVRTVLRAIRDLPGVSASTELAVELTLSTVTEDFLDALVEHDTTKVSFGLQSLDPAVRKHMRQPPGLHHLERVLRWLDGRVPIVNADLITGLPGQDLGIVNRDLRGVISDPRIHAVSSYLLTAGAAPALIGALESHRVPPVPAPATQAAMRLHTYSTLQREGWIRRGTNTYVDPERVPADVLERVSGNECIGAPDYEAFLLGVGAQAVSCLPGARVENLVDVERWCLAVERGESPWYLPKCSTAHLRDIALWVMPLRWEGLPRARFQRMLTAGAVTAAQLRTLSELVREGLVVETERGHELSILGEVFMGHLVRDLKRLEERAAVDDYVREGWSLGRAMAAGRVADTNDANNRQIAGQWARS